MSKTLGTLIDAAYRDLADEAKEVFSALQVEDFVRGGIAEINRISPQELKEVIDTHADPITGITSLYEFELDMDLIYRVEVERVADGWTTLLGEAVEGQTVSTGWVFRRLFNGGRLEFPKWWLREVNWNQYYLIVHGYRPRPQPANLGEEVPLSDQEEYSVRAYARAMGYDLMAHDRSLFTQWQGQTNNSDVSPTQMMQMAASAKDEWDRHRGLIRTVRRYW